MSPTRISLLLIGTLLTFAGSAQETVTPNGIEDVRLNAIAITGVTLYQPDGQYLENAVVLMREGRIVSISDNPAVPDDYFVVDLAGRYLYPGLIDAYTEYGIPGIEPPVTTGNAERLDGPQQALNTKETIRAHFRASLEFAHDEETRKNLRDLGFSTVLSLRADGIARGTSALVTLGDESANESVLVPDVAAHFSFSRGTTHQSLPSSPMGAVALLRQTYLDAQWFAQQNPRPFTDESLEALLRTGSLPQIMEVETWQQALTADHVGDEFLTQYILKVGNDAYQQAQLIEDTDAVLIVPVNFPAAPEVSDALDADELSFADLKHWELAAYNLRLLNEQGVEFAITSHGAGKDFWKNMRAAVAKGLPEQVAVDALTRIPAQLLNMENRIGQLQSGALANLLISSGPLFAEDTRLLENWIRGERFVLDASIDGRSGQYQLVVGSDNYNFELDFDKGKVKASLVSTEEGVDEIDVTLELTEDLISFSFAEPDIDGLVRLNGWPLDAGWQGTGLDQSGAPVAWQLTYVQPLVPDAAAAVAEIDMALPAPVLHPFEAFGRETIPVSQDMVIRNATVWTNEDAGTLITDVLVRDGRIAAVGTGLRAGDALEIDATGKHLTPGIIDEHSHIALTSINESATNSSMVRMRDVLDSEDVNIYRNLAGGVTAAQLLHGSANPIGGQSAIIKMKWGMAPEALLIEDAPPFIKFALGENVKRSTNPASIRYPQTRMGVEQVFVDAFSQAREYGRRWDDYNSLSAAAKRSTTPPRRDLVNETMLEILNKERYVTSHSYVQSEINMLMTVAESFDFNINTFTHILEGYKVADKMAEHGAGGSTFADWWGYKWEVRYAIPYNAALMHQAGVVVAINSDDAEMSRRLNQEAAKIIKYGDLSEIDALKLVTLNPAILLHLDHRMGSIREGKDADLVLWSDHPLSVYAVPETTWIEGVPYYDRQSDQSLREMVGVERARIMAKIAAADSGGNDNSGNGEEEPAHEE